MTYSGIISWYYLSNMEAASKGITFFKRGNADPALYIESSMQISGASPE
jgi:hypothetical protein